MSETLHAVEPAPPAPIAQAARAYGDEYPLTQPQAWLRLAALVLGLASVWYLPWMIRSLDWRVAWLAIPFAVANVFTICSALLSVLNSWQRRVPERTPLPYGEEPLVGVIIPTCGEPIPMILRTVLSVLDQDWPLEAMRIVVSDDGHDEQLRATLADLPVLYHSPPPRYAPGRDGAAKAGNLNSALAFLREACPEIRYVETRDADDELGSHGFLRQVVGQLARDPRLAFVQTIKEAQVAPGDPFNNRESIFYRSQMLARNAANAVFPCGSGVVWRRQALEQIGDFPTWNLVEDLQSGVEALRLGWRGLYLPIVGAVPQHSPHDVPNFYKQRGTWALDTVRLMLWGNLSELRLRQRLHFLELLLFYLASFTTPIYLASLAAALLGAPPISDRPLGFIGHMLPLVLATELWLFVLNQPYNDRRKRQRHPYRELWKVRTMWAGLAPVFIKATAQAILAGPARKPSYRVTLKTDDVRWHWRHTLPQAVLIVTVLVVAVYAVRYGTYPNPTLLLGSIYWGTLNVALLGTFISRSWHGLKVAGRLLPRRQQNAAAAAQA
ncbi:MAG TPA: glycosyltransferase family 2 protein [Gaiellaceae bacterium]|nr:glycosyltransferase family 2 protein [Gaiellaceae bacterium]